MNSYYFAICALTHQTGLPISLLDNLDFDCYKLPFQAPPLDAYETPYPEFYHDDLSLLYFDNIFKFPSTSDTSLSIVFNYFFTLPDHTFQMASAVSKEFDSVPKLQSNGSNYHIWINRVKMAICTCKAAHINDLVHVAVPGAGGAPAINADSDEHIEAHDHVLNVIGQKLHDTTF